MSETLNKIKQRGYWEVVIRPNEFVEKRIEPIGRCKETIRELAVHLRGWDYPHYDTHDPVKTKLDYVEQETEWKFFIELWRYYQSGQFVHFFAVHEDWMEQNPFGSLPNFTPGQALWIDGTIYTFTEIYELASRMASRSLLGDTCKISVTLHRTKGRGLVYADPARMLFAMYRSDLEDIPLVDTIATTELVARSAELACKQAAELFQRFNWSNITAQAVRHDQEQLLGKKR